MIWIFPKILTPQTVDHLLTRWSDSVTESEVAFSNVLSPTPDPVFPPLLFLINVSCGKYSVLIGLSAKEFGASTAFSSATNWESSCVTLFDQVARQDLPESWTIIFFPLQLPPLWITFQAHKTYLFRSHKFGKMSRGHKSTICWENFGEVWVISQGMEKSRSRF